MRAGPRTLTAGRHTPGKDPRGAAARRPPVKPERHVGVQLFPIAGCEVGSHTHGDARERCDEFTPVVRLQDRRCGALDRDERSAHECWVHCLRTRWQNWVSRAQLRPGGFSAPGHGGEWVWRARGANGASTTQQTCALGWIWRRSTCAMPRKTATSRWRLRSTFSAGLKAWSTSKAILPSRSGTPASNTSCACAIQWAAIPSSIRRAKAQSLQAPTWHRCCMSCPVGD